MLLLAFELVVTRYMTLENVGRDATVVPDKLVAQSGTGKLGLRLRSDRLLRPSVHGDEQRTARQSDLDSARVSTDRKSTRLNSSHSQISYAVFCLKKKKRA